MPILSAIQYCDHCGEETSAERNHLCDGCRNNYFRCAGCDSVTHYIHESRTLSNYCDSCRPNRNQVRFSLQPIGSPPFLGVELEVESDENDFDKARTETVRVMPDGFVQLKEDGSLSNNGFEIVTRPANIADHKLAWPRFFTAVRAGTLGHLTSWSNNTCGLHVHICRKGSDGGLPFESDQNDHDWQLSEHAIALIVCFVNLPRNQRFIQTIAGRDQNSYARFQRKCMSNAARNTGDKYEAVNLCHSQTLEFRIFKGTLNERSFYKALEFTLALSCFCKGLYNVRKALSISAFIKYVGEHHEAYPHLDSFISNRWYGKPDRTGASQWRLKNNRKPPLPPVDHGNQHREEGF